VGGAPLSGVVIASQFVLTAGHVVAGQSAANIRFALNLGAAQWVAEVISVTVYPSYSFPYDDLARTGTNSVDVFATSLDTSGHVSRFFLYDFDGRRV